MIKVLMCSIISFPLLFGLYNINYSSKHSYSTVSVVTLVGAKILSSKSDSVEKYKREDCPVCKGKGWYISGDGIAKINCQYCEP
jgi:hypothetical protein